MPSIPRTPTTQARIDTAVDVLSTVAVTFWKIADDTTDAPLLLVSVLLGEVALAIREGRLHRDHLQAALLAMTNR
jgi:hypothetical protein